MSHILSEKAFPDRKRVSFKSLSYWSSIGRPMPFGVPFLSIDSTYVVLPTTVYLSQTRLIVMIQCYRIEI